MDEPSPPVRGQDDQIAPEPICLSQNLVGWDSLGQDRVVLYQAVHPGAALLIGPILICAPYALSRGLMTRLARWWGKRAAADPIPRDKE